MQLGIYSPLASTSVDNCSILHSAGNVPQKMVSNVKASTKTWIRSSVDPKEAASCGRTGCCAGSFYHDEYAVTGSGLKIDLKDNSSAVTSNAFPFQVSLEHMRISSDRTFAVGVSWWYDSTNQLYGSSRFYRLNLTTGELITIAGLVTNLDPYGTPIDGPGAIATFDGLIFDVALSPDGSFALVVGLYSRTVRKVDVSSGFVTTISQGPATGVDIAPDGSFAVSIDTTTLSKIDLVTKESTLLASIEVSTYPPQVRISPDALFLVFANGCRVYQLFLDNSAPILIAGGEPSGHYCTGYSDGPGTTSEFGIIDDLAISNTGRFVLLFDLGDWSAQTEELKIRRIDLQSLQVSTLVSGQILQRSDFSNLIGSLSIVGSCDLCPAGSYSAVPGSLACASCGPGSFQNASGATSCAPGTKPQQGPTPTPAPSGCTRACGAEHSEQCFVHSVASPNADLRLGAPSGGYVPVSITVWAAGATPATDGLAVWMAWEDSTTLCAISATETALTWSLFCGGPGDALYLALPYALRGGKGITVKVCMRRARDELDLGPALLKVVHLEA